MGNPIEERGPYRTMEKMSKKALCGAKLRKKPGRTCQKPPMVGKSRCKYHGGLSLAGTASPSYRDGRYSKYLPFGLPQKFADAMADPDWLSLEKEIKLVDATLAEVLEGLGGGMLQEYQVERITSLIEQRRKLVESEARRLKDHDHMISIEQMLGLTKLLLESIQEVAGQYVTEDRRAHFLADINQTVHRLLSRPARSPSHPTKPI